MFIAFTGPQSSGKSTIIEAIKQHFPNFIYKPSATRTIQQKGFTINNVGNTFDDTQREVINSHLDNIEFYLQNGGDVVIDRCILDGVVYTDYFYRQGKVSDQVFNYGLDGLKKFYSIYDIVFYLSPKGVPLADDKVRSTDIEFRNAVTGIFEEYLKEYTAVELVGGVDDRVNKVVHTINEHI